MAAFHGECDALVNVGRCSFGQTQMRIVEVDDTESSKPVGLNHIML
jgi:hypothetical protein